MQVQDPLMNNIYDVPDDTTPEEIAAIQTSVQQQAKQRQALMAGLGSMGQTLMQAVTPQQHFPVISPAGAASMTPQAFQQFVGQQQESIERGKDREYQGQRDQARMSLEERVMTQRALEAEKDRAQLLKVEQARLKNAETIRKMQEDSEVRKAEIKAKEKDDAAKRPKVMSVGGGAYQFTPGESGFETKMLVPPKASGGGKGGGGGGSSGGGTAKTPTLKEKYLHHPRLGYGTVDENDVFHPLTVAEQEKAMPELQAEWDKQKQENIKLIASKFDTSQPGQIEALGIAAEALTEQNFGKRPSKTGQFADWLDSVVGMLPKIPTGGSLGGSAEPAPETVVGPDGKIYRFTN